ncbi:hypothetical protein ACF1G5_30305 [Streptomyces coeruleorubidus]|uniref:hypothetical protein n=1 Tax=Streptomyces coeruleorubidus TaxID=116188 RepID=UPI0036FD5DE1
MIGDRRLRTAANGQAQPFRDLLSGGAPVLMTPAACRSSMRRSRSGVVEAIISGVRHSGSRARSSPRTVTSSPSP